MKNKLFATLDPTARKLTIEGIEFLIVDTVGFLQDLPHNLIEAFKSTLESALHCDLALIVCDATGEYDMQMQTTLQTLQEMDFSSPYLLIMNKSENVTDFSVFPRESVMISAKERLGIEGLKRKILEFFKKDFLFCELFVPYEKSNEYAKLKPYLYERRTEFSNEGQTIWATIPSRYAKFFNEYIK